MEITSRQFGQIEAACFALEEATEKNNTALRLVSVIKDNLAEIAKTYCPLEIAIEFEEPELPLALSDSSDQSSPSALRSAATSKSDIKAEVACNTMICLTMQETFLLNRQITRLAAEFEQEGGFTERLYRVRSATRQKQQTPGSSDKSDKSD